VTVSDWKFIFTLFPINCNSNPLIILSPFRVPCAAKMKPTSSERTFSYNLSYLRMLEMLTCNYHQASQNVWVECFIGTVTRVHHPEPIERTKSHTAR
jgi:hypothetical protein